MYVCILQKLPAHGLWLYRARKHSQPWCNMLTLGNSNFNPPQLILKQLWANKGPAPDYVWVVPAPDYVRGSQQQTMGPSTRLCQGVPVPDYVRGSQHQTMSGGPSTRLCQGVPAPDYDRGYQHQTMSGGDYVKGVPLGRSQHLTITNTSVQ